MAEAARTPAPPAPKPPEHAPKPAKPKPKPKPHTSSGKPALQPAPELPEPAAEPEGKKAGPAPPAKAPPAPPRPPTRLTPAPGPGGTAGGLPGPVAGAISGSLGVDVSPVRVHTDASAAEAASMLGARAVTAGPNVLLGRGERPTDLPLMAHEVAHAVQQRGAPRVQLWSRSGGDAYEQEAQRASAAVVSGRPFTVVGRTPPRPQRWGISDVLDWFADKANYIPGFRMFTIVIGVNPINGATVERSGANILRAAVEFIPGGHLVVEALEKYGIFEKGGAWLEQQVKTLGMTGRMFIDALKEFIDSLGWTDIFHPGRVWDRAKAIFTAPIKRLIDFFVGLVKGILKLIKDAILKPLAALASKTPAWDLLLAVLGKNPITDEPVKQDAGAVIGGFMKLIGQEELWNNIQRAHALPRAWAWFKGALAGLLAFVRQIPGLFLSALASLTIEDIVILPKAFIKVGKVFVGFAGKFVSWAFQQVLGLLQIIFEVVAPGAVPYIRKAAGAFNQILRAPAAFLGNLVRAGRLGFDRFRKNFLAHLRKSIIDWLTGSLAGAGVYIPQAFELKEIVKFVLSVLGLTWENIRGKLVRAIGEPALKALETGFDLVVTLVKEGPAAAWEKIKESLSNLKEMVMSQILDWVKGTIVEIAITKILSFLSPVGAFIQAIISIYRTIMFFVQRLRQIAMVVASFIDSIAAIAAGAIGSAASRVEATLAGFLTTVISFLANFIGLGGVGERVKKIIASIRAPIDKALDKVVDWIVTMAKKAGKFLLSKVTRPAAKTGPAGQPAGDARTPIQKEADLDKAIGEAQALEAKPDITEDEIKQALPAIQSKYKLTSLQLVVEKPEEGGDVVHVEGMVNPKKSTKAKLVATAGKITSLVLPRPGSFSSSTAKALNPHNLDLVKAELDRCHIVSSQDVAAHYETTLTGKKLSDAKKLLDPKLAGVGLPAVGDPPTGPGVLKSVKALHKKFFNDLSNLFLGDSSENRSIGQAVDPRKPGMTTALLNAHIKLIEAKYAVGTLKITR